MSGYGFRLRVTGYGDLGFLISAKASNDLLRRMLISAKASNDLLRRMLISAKASNDRLTPCKFQIKH